MKAKIHPEYVESTVHCACGNRWRDALHEADMHVEICSACHPFFTGQQRIVDTAGRVERFAKRLEKSTKAKQKAEAKEKAKPPEPVVVVTDRLIPCSPERGRPTGAAYWFPADCDLEHRRHAQSRARY